MRNIVMNPAQNVRGRRALIVRACHRFRHFNLLLKSHLHVSTAAEVVVIRLRNGLYCPEGISMPELRLIEKINKKCWKASLWIDSRSWERGRAPRVRLRRKWERASEERPWKHRSSWTKDIIEIFPVHRVMKSIDGVWRAHRIWICHSKNVMFWVLTWQSDWT